jgi:nicotinamidase-related amidase
MNTLPANTALLVIDVQEGFDDPQWGRRNNDPGAENNIARLLAAWRRASMPIYHVAHFSLIPGSPFMRDASGARIKAVAAPLEGEPVIRSSTAHSSGQTWNNGCASKTSVIWLSRA